MIEFKPNQTFSFVVQIPSKQNCNHGNYDGINDVLSGVDCSFFASTKEVKRFPNIIKRKMNKWKDYFFTNTNSGAKRNHRIVSNIWKTANGTWTHEIILIRNERELIETLPIFMEHCLENMCMKFLANKDVHLLDFERIVCFVKIRTNEELDNNFGFNVNPRISENADEIVEKAMRRNDVWSFAQTRRNSFICSPIRFKLKPEIVERKIMQFDMMIFGYKMKSFKTLFVESVAHTIDFQRFKYTYYKRCPLCSSLGPKLAIRLNTRYERFTPSWNVPDLPLDFQAKFLQNWLCTWFKDRESLKREVSILDDKEDSNSKLNVQNVKERDEATKDCIRLCIARSNKDYYHPMIDGGIYQLFDTKENLKYPNDSAETSNDPDLLSTSRYSPTISDYQKKEKEKTKKKRKKKKKNKNKKKKTNK